MRRKISREREFRLARAPVSARGVAKRSVTIVRGETSRDKVVLVAVPLKSDALGVPEADAAPD